MEKNRKDEGEQRKDGRIKPRKARDRAEQVCGKRG